MAELEKKFSLYNSDGTESLVVKGSENGIEEINNCSIVDIKTRKDIQTINTQLGDIANKKNDYILNAKQNSNEIHSITEKGYENFDSTKGIQSILDYGGRGRGRKVFIPSGKYKISDTLIVPSTIHLEGYGNMSGDENGNGTELIWEGNNGKPCILTATAELDFGKEFQGSISNLRIIDNSNDTESIGLKFRNPQNGAYLKNLIIKGFKKRQIVIYEENATTTGTCPGFSHIDNCFFIGGEYPVEIFNGVEQFNFMNCGIDTDINSLGGVLISNASFNESQRWGCKFDSCKIEIQQVSNDIDGIIINNKGAITFINTTIQRNSNINSTKSAILNNLKENLNSIKIINCTSWNLLNTYSNPIYNIPAISITTPQNFNNFTHYHNIQFSYNNLQNSLSSLNINNGYLISENCILKSINGLNSTNITSGQITLKIIKNGGTFVKSLVLRTDNYRRFTEFELESNLIFSKGDRVNILIDTSDDFAPLQSNLSGEILFETI